MAEAEKTKTTKAVKATKAFDAVPDGEIYPVSFKVGDELSGKIAEMAIGEGWAKA